MAYTVELTDQQKRSVAQQIGGKLSLPTTPMSDAPGAAPPLQEVTETFPVWIADDRINAAPGGTSNLLSAGARDTGTFHHNIAVTNSAPGSADSQSVVASARSVIQGPGGIPKVEAITTPPPGNELPRWIRNAAYWIETNAPGNPLVRLLVIPSRYMHCFWLSYPDKDSVVVIDMPESFKNLEYRHIYDSADFFDRLQKEPKTEGLPLAPTR
jgi:hypothetical protein